MAQHQDATLIISQINKLRDSPPSLGNARALLRKPRRHGARLTYHETFANVPQKLYPFTMLGTSYAKANAQTRAHWKRSLDDALSPDHYGGERERLIETFSKRQCSSYVNVGAQMLSREVISRLDATFIEASLAVGYVSVLYGSARLAEYEDALQIEAEVAWVRTHLAPMFSRLVSAMEDLVGWWLYRHQPIRIAAEWDSAICQLVADRVTLIYEEAA